MNVALPAHGDGLDLALVDQVVESSALDSEEPLNILPTPEFGQYNRLDFRCFYFVGGHCIHKFWLSLMGSSQFIRRLLQFFAFIFIPGFRCRYQVLRKRFPAYYNYFHPLL